MFKLFFIPLDNRVRFNIQSKIEGLVNESARFIAGVLIFGLAFIPFFKVIHISIFLVILSGLYFIVVNKLYHGYRNKLRMKLESGDAELEKLERGYAQITSRLESMLSLPSPRKAIFSYKLLVRRCGATGSTHSPCCR